MFKTLFVAIAILISAQSVGATNVTVEDYIKAGIPAPSRDWIGVDYNKAAQVISSGSVPLPTYATPEGHEILERFLAKDRLPSYRKKAISVQGRFSDYLQLQQGLSGLLGTYYEIAAKELRLTSEVADLMALNIHVTAQSVDLLDEFVSVVPRERDTPEFRVAVRKMYQGITSIFMNSLLMTTEQSIFSTSERTVILDALAASLPSVKGTFSSEVRLEMSEHLKRAKEVLKGENDARTIDRMLTELKS